MKKNLIILTIAIIILAVIIILTNKTKTVPIQESNLTQENTPANIEEELNMIKIDSEIDTEMQIIDNDLNNL